MSRSLQSDPNEHFLLDEARIKDWAKLERFVEAVNRHPDVYHCLPLTPDLCIKGTYDLRRYLHFYNLPENMEGKEVLDIGTASGFFALECARRGGTVTAVDIYDAVQAEAIAACTDLNFRYEQRSVYDLTPEFGQFDLVICGSLLLHLSDPFAALQRIAGVCRGHLSVSTASVAESASTERPVCEYHGWKSENGDYFTHFLFSAEALKRMLFSAGFARVDKVEHFSLDSEAGATAFATPHLAMCAFR